MTERARLRVGVLLYDDFVLSNLAGPVDVLRIAFFAYATWLGWRITEIMEFQRMVVIDVSMSWVFGICTLGLAVVTLRAVQVALKHWREGESPLTRVSVEGRHQ